MKEKIAVSACLLGLDTKYNGKNNFNEKLFEYLKDYTVLPICPEVFSGLSTPRIPSERKDDKVFMEDGSDVTDYFILGAKRTLDFLKENGCTKVILKNGSPSCGTTYIYDGSFTHKKIEGVGFTTELLKNNGIEVILYDEN